MTCNKCGNTKNKEYSTFDISVAGSVVANGIDGMDKSFLEGIAFDYLEPALNDSNVKMKVVLCQRCISNLFRGLHKNK